MVMPLAFSFLILSGEGLLSLGKNKSTYSGISAFRKNIMISFCYFPMLLRSHRLVVWL